MTFKTSNTEWIEKLSDFALSENLRNYLEEGQNITCVFFDLVDEASCRLSKTDKIKNG